MNKNTHNHNTFIDIVLYIHMCINHIEFAVRKPGWKEVVNTGAVLSLLHSATTILSCI